MEEMEEKLSGNYLMLTAGLCLQDSMNLQADGDVISIRGQDMKYMYIPTGIKKS